MSDKAPAETSAYLLQLEVLHGHKEKNTRQEPTYHQRLNCDKVLQTLQLIEGPFPCLLHKLFHFTQINSRLIKYDPTTTKITRRMRIIHYQF